MGAVTRVVALLLCVITSGLAFVAPPRGGRARGVASQRRRSPSPTCALASPAELASVADSLVALPTQTLTSVSTTLPLAGNALFSNEDISQAFTVATFLPQPFWLLVILAPNAGITDKIIRPWGPTLALTAVHFFIVVASLGQDGGTAPIAEFSQVFDPAGDPLGAFLGMVRYPNFVAEEWAHVLAWDFFVGRWIWLDGRARGVFTPHSTLLTNLIGPPGLLLHFATCLVTGKGLPPTPEGQGRDGDGNGELE